jgi:tRNA pseudouridine38-40 synthase
MPSFKVTIAYDGTDYIGWQRQANGVSIQGVIEEALRDLDEREVAVTGAGRTDAGVHALGQVAAFTIRRALTPDTMARALNARLPPAIRVVSADEVEPAFHPRFDAHAKTYRYRIWNADVLSPFEHRYAWHVVGALDVDAMRDAARFVRGRHDFAAFQSAGSDVATSTRTVTMSRISVTKDPADVPGGGAVIAYEVTGDGFLRHMVRAIAGTLVEIGRGRQPAEWMAHVVASRNRGAAGPTAPASGLFLVSVAYAGALAAGS